MDRYYQAPEVRQQLVRAQAVVRGWLARRRFARLRLMVCPPPPRLPDAPGPGAVSLPDGVGESYHPCPQAQQCARYPHKRTFSHPTCFSEHKDRWSYMCTGMQKGARVMQKKYQRRSCHTQSLSHGVPLLAGRTRWMLTWRSAWSATSGSLPSASSAPSGRTCAGTRRSPRGWSDPIPSPPPCNPQNSALRYFKCR